MGYTIDGSRIKKELSQGYDSVLKLETSKVTALVG